MADTVEGVALELAKAILEAEGRTLGASMGQSNCPTKVEILSAYRDALSTVKGIVIKSPVKNDIASQYGQD